MYTICYFATNLLLNVKRWTPIRVKLINHIKNNCLFYREIDLFRYLIGVTFRYKLNGFGPEVYFAITNGIIIFTAYIAVLITIMSSLDIPASISLRFDTASVAANPIFNNNCIY